MRGKRKEGKPLPDTQDMKLWREEFNQMSVEEHHNKLKALGLSDEDVEEFDEGLKELDEEPKETLPPKKKGK